jgi:hypothetical protein
MKKKQLTAKQFKALKLTMLGLRWDAIGKNTKADNLLNALNAVKPDWAFTKQDFADFFASRGIKQPV